MNGAQPALTDTTLLGESGFRTPPHISDEASETDDDDIPPLEDVRDGDSFNDQPRFHQSNQDSNGAASAEPEETNGPVLGKEERQRLFQTGRQQEADGNDSRALETYFKCLRGVRPETAFPELPVCLRSVAEIHYRKEEYEKAIHFIQAEKLYYEAALLDTSVLQKLLDQNRNSSANSEDDRNMQMMRADEYESLSRYCLDKKQAQLALEYAAKAAKLRQFCLGEDHPETIRSLDYVTMVYAEVGKQEYAESLNKFDAAKSNETRRQAATMTRQQNETSARQTGQRQPIETVEREIRISLIFFSLMIFVACAVLTVISFYTYCKYLDTSSCEALTSYIKDHYDWLRYLVFTSFFALPPAQ